MVFILFPFIKVEELVVIKKSEEITFRVLSKLCTQGNYTTKLNCNTTGNRRFGIRIFFW